MNQSHKTLDLKIGSSANFLEQILTKDVSTLEAIYDLIDNSIDAARNSIFASKNYEADEFGLPTNYKNYEVEIQIDQTSFSIRDNCLGIPEDILINKTFIIAESSAHEYGIGQYGIGLKRSLLKLGNLYSFIIDNGEKKYTAEFDNESFGLKKNLSALVTSSSGSSYTIFTVRDLKLEAIKDIQNAKWIEKAIKGLQDRYSIYFSKGLVIKFKYNNKYFPLTLKNTIPNLRTDGKFLPKNKSLKFGDVKVIIESGIHQDYYFSSESKHSLSINRKLTPDFGIYFICNDRVIVKSSTEQNHGWKTKWHSEYNGFVCIVRFISKDPSDLPWNTSKSAMREDAPLFLEVIEELQPVADIYRSEIKSRYGKNKKEKDNITEINSKLETTKNGNTNKHYFDNQGSLFDIRIESNLIEHQLLEKNTTNEYSDKIETIITEKLPTNIIDDKQNSFEKNEYRKDKEVTVIETKKKERLKRPQYAKSIIDNQEMIIMINKLNIPKFNSLYKSLLEINPETHPLLTVVGIWAFLDSLARVDPNYNGADFSGYYNGRLQKFNFNDREQLKIVKKLFEWFLHEGNFDKHDNDYATLNGLDVAYKFNKLQPVIANIIEHYILPQI
ncbi:ATP-binding protein [Acinetobacter baumannii]|nr:ATP-binding protein [Acinetobacter baumannii]